MMPFNNFTTKAKEAVRKAHELAIERGQSAHQYLRGSDWRKHYHIPQDVNGSVYASTDSVKLGAGSV